MPIVTTPNYNLPAPDDDEKMKKGAERMRALADATEVALDTVAGQVSAVDGQVSGVTGNISAVVSDVAALAVRVDALTAELGTTKSALNTTTGKLATTTGKLATAEATLSHAKTFWEKTAYTAYYLRIAFAGGQRIPAGRTYKISLTNMKRGETPFDTRRNQLLGFSPSQILLSINGMASGATSWRPSISNSSTNSISVYLYAQNIVDTKTGRTYFVRMFVVNPAYDAGMSQATPSILSHLPPAEYGDPKHEDHPEDYTDVIDLGEATETSDGFEIVVPVDPAITVVP